MSEHISKKEKVISFAKEKTSKGKSLSGQIKGPLPQGPLKPKAKLRLDRKVLNEFITRGLRILNTHVDNSLVVYSYRKKCFVHTEQLPTEVLICYENGALFHNDSPEAIRQLEAEEYDTMFEAMAGTQIEDDEEKEERDLEEDEEEDVEEEGDVEEEETETILDEEAKEDQLEAAADQQSEEGLPFVRQIKKLKNKFNFSERASQTYSTVSKEDSSQTIPPPTARVAYQVCQWNIYDSYQEDYDAMLREKERERKEKFLVTKGKEHEKKKEQDLDINNLLVSRKLQAVKILERMVNQNIFDDFAMDCLYYEDPSDKYSEPEGSVLPLWHFQLLKTKNCSITDLLWSPKYFDLFAVTYGSLNLHNPTSEGFLVLYTLKNPSYPEYVATYPSGVMCVDFHPTKVNYVACGVQDGAVIVYNINKKKAKPTHISSVHQKHSGTVWQVVWGNNSDERTIGFYSASSDGGIYKWTVVQNELMKSIVITFFYEITAISTLDNIEFEVTESVTCLTFHPQEDEIFLVGTSKGAINKCSVAYSTTYLFEYEAHTMDVHRIKYNPYRPSLFASCSSDCAAKIWEDNRRAPLFTFDLECPIGDIQWAPYSSTIFATVTSNGLVQVFDLNLNKYDSICIQTVVQVEDNELTRLQFNPKLPILVVGDTTGHVQSLKLSPNLRLKTKAPKKEEEVDPLTLELQKLEKLLAYM